MILSTRLLSFLSLRLSLSFVVFQIAISASTTEENNEWLMQVLSAPLGGANVLPYYIYNK